jgi:hypothetical protein
MADEVQVIGEAEATAAVAAWVDRLPADIEKSLSTFENQLRDRLSNAQPYISGTLAGSAEIEPPAVDALFGLVLGREVVYAGWVEFGGSRGRPYVAEGRTVYPTAQEGEQEFYAQVEKATGASIESYPWPQAGG